MRAGITPTIIGAPTALITGSGAGIGKELALELAGMGYTVYASVRDVKKAQASFGKAAETPGLRIVQLDVRKPEQAVKTVRSIMKESGRLDVLVNNAGFGLYGVFEELTDEQYRDQFETNFFGSMNLVRAALPFMREKGRGKIVNITSILGRMVLPTGSAYCSSKWALEAFSEALRYEVAPFGIRVVAIEPGLIRTNFKKNMVYSRSKTDASSPYRPLNAMMESQGEYRGFSTSAQDAARKIARIIEKKNPGPRYRVGMDAHAVNMLTHLLGSRIIDFIFRSVVLRQFRKFDRSNNSRN